MLTCSVTVRCAILQLIRTGLKTHTGARICGLCMQAILGSLLLGEAVTVRWGAGACCLVAGQALIALAARRAGGSSAPSEPAKAD